MSPHDPHTYHLPDPVGEDRAIDPDVEIVLAHDEPHRLREEIDIIFTIFIGGALGTLSRYLVVAHWYQATEAFPVTVLVINLTGSFVIGAILSLIQARRRPSRYLRPLTCVGFLGGWTTMSTVALAFDHLISSNHPLTAFAYIAAAALGTPLSALVGIRSVRPYLLGRAEVAG